MVYIRGQHEDFDHWRQLGNPGWSAADVLPYFKRSERNTRGQDDWHGKDGQLSVSDASYSHPICDAFVDAAVELWISRNNDFNGESQEGVGHCAQTTTRNGKRCSTAAGYLHPAMKRGNLRVITRALTERVIFDGKRAVGVAFRENGTPKTVRARREVILCGGAIGSLHVLLMSGKSARRSISLTRASRLCTTCRGSGSSQDHYSAAVKTALPGKDHLQRCDDESAEATRGRHALSGVPRRSIDHGRGPLRAVCANPARAGDAGCETVDLAVQFGQSRGGVTQVFRLHCDRVSTAAGQPGGNPPESLDAAATPSISSALFVRSERSNERWWTG